MIQANATDAESSPSSSLPPLHTLYQEAFDVSLGYLVFWTVCTAVGYSAVYLLSDFIASQVSLLSRKVTAELIWRVALTWIWLIHTSYLLVSLVDNRVPFTTSSDWTGKESVASNAFGLFQVSIESILINTGFLLARIIQERRLRHYMTDFKSTSGTLIAAVVCVSLYNAEAVETVWICLFLSCKAVVSELAQISELLKSVHFLHTSVILSGLAGSLSAFAHILSSVYFLTLVDADKALTHANSNLTGVLWYYHMTLYLQFVAFRLLFGGHIVSVVTLPLLNILLSIVYRAMKVFAVETVYMLSLQQIANSPFYQLAQRLAANPSGANSGANSGLVGNDAQSEPEPRAASAEMQQINSALQSSVAAMDVFLGLALDTAALQEDSDRAGASVSDEDMVEQFLIDSGFVVRSAAPPMSPERRAAHVVSTRFQDGVRPGLVDSAGQTVDGSNGSSSTTSRSPSLPSRRRSDGNGRYMLRPSLSLAASLALQAHSSSPLSSASTSLQPYISSSLAYPRLDAVDSEEDEASDADWSLSEELEKLARRRQSRAASLSTSALAHASAPERADEADSDNSDGSVDSSDEELLEEFAASNAPASALRRRANPHADADIPSSETILLIHDALRPLYAVLEGALELFAGRRSDFSSADSDNPLDIANELSMSNSVLLRWMASSLLDSLTQNNEKNRCVICLHNTRQYTLLDCGHFCICEHCVMRSGEHFLQNCPVCKQRVVRIVKTFA